MSSSFDLDGLVSFAAGAEGPPGQRVFYLQAVAPDRVVTLRVEKQQVALLADSIDRLLSTVDIQESGPAHMPELRDPVLAEWTVGQMMLAVNHDSSRIVVIGEEFDPDALDADDPDDAEVAQARFALTRGQAEAFVDGARRLVMSGRPTCRLCGRPMDADGHFCPRLN